MRNFKLFNNIAGWLAFAVAAITYLLTIEPTASFWDCGEFAASAYKLEVGHPPGAPFFMLTGRMFSLFASDPTQVAAMINSMSALCSAFTILFLFWTITHIARRVVLNKEADKLSLSQGIAILGAGMVGALAYTFSDTFWFSAVEGEVYAYSSFFTAVVFWCILKWEDAAESPTAARWIILIAYLMGLSIGVHLLNLLAIPAIVLVYYFKNYQVNTKNTFIALGVSVLVLAFILYGMVPGFVKVASVFELLFVNGFGLGYNSGFLTYVIVTAAILVWSIYQITKGTNETLLRIAFILAITSVGIPFFTDSYIMWILITAAFATLMFVVKQWNRNWLHLIVMCATVMLIGYSSYTMIVVRSLANTPMDQNSPEDVFTLQSFLNREQYGDRPLFYGGMYSAPEIRDVKGNQCVARPIEGATQWQKAVILDENDEPKYLDMGKKNKGYEKDPRFEMLFPRMYSSQGHHVDAYKTWADIKGKKIRVDQCGNDEVRVMPTFGENLKFFFKYQVNFMYMRYFLWNFSGRQNDIQGHGEIDRGNWITGIPFVDNAMYGDQAALEAAQNNKGNNKYYMLPLLLGIFGMLWQFSQKNKGSQSFWIVFTLFFMTGIAIVVYLNQTPYQPRERDYAYAGSFYAFSIWIGLGVMYLYHMLGKYVNKTAVALIVSLLSLGVPVLMACENWDDHDRSDRYVARDSGRNYLESCEKNGIIYSNGDNDTFPLWYNQEVEGNRTDMRVCNLSYLQTDWYAEQMQRQAYESDPLPITWTKKDYAAGNLDYAMVYDHPQFGGRLDVKTAFTLMRDPRFIDENRVGTVFASTLTIPVDKEQVLRSGTVAPEDSALIVDEIEIKLGRHITRSQMMFLEILSSNNWERPIYVSATVGEEFYPKVREYMQLEGLAYRIVPIKNRNRVNTEVMYDNMMNKFKFGNFNGDIYVDEQHQRTARTIRMMFTELADALIANGEKEKAKKVLDRSIFEIPESAAPFDHSAAMMAESYYRLGETKIADSLMLTASEKCIQRIEWTLSLSEEQRKAVSMDFNLNQNIALLQNFWRTTDRFKSELKPKFEEKLMLYYPLVQR